MTTQQEKELIEEIQRMSAKMIEDAQKDEKELREELQRMKRLAETLSDEDFQTCFKAFQERNRARLLETIDQKLAITEAQKKYMLLKLNQLNE